MPVEITEKLMSQLGKYIDHYKNQWGDIILELPNNEFFLFYGELRTIGDNISFKGIKGAQLILSFNKKINKPTLTLVEKDQICKYNSFKNLYIFFELSGESISNQWEPPKGVKYSGRVNVNFPIMSELELRNVTEDIWANKGKLIQLDINYFDEDSKKLKAFIEGSEIGTPKIKRILIQGEIIHNDSIIEFIETNNNESISLFYLQSLQVPVLMGLKFNNEIRISDIQYIII